MMMANGTAHISQYPILTKEDCNASTAITDPNAPGQSQLTLPWFWTQIEPDSQQSEDYMTECELLIVHLFYSG